MSRRMTFFEAGARTAQCEVGGKPEPEPEQKRRLTNRVIAEITVITGRMIDAEQVWLLGSKLDGLWDAAYEAGARSRDEEVERLRAALDTAAQLLDANRLFIHATIVCAALKKETEAARRAGKGSKP